MGQAASRVVGAASRAAQTQRTRAAAEAEWKRRSAAEYNPTRGQNHQAEVENGLAAAAARAGGGDVAKTTDGGGAAPELPPDLVQFLNDAGPLERKVDRDRTSAKVYDALVEDEHARIAQEKEANKRVRRRMPIVTSRGGDDASALGDLNDGSTTERTTNFSTRERSTTGRLGVTREDLFRLSDKLKDMASDAPEWKKAIEKEYAVISKNGNKSKDFDQLQDRVLFENSLRYIGVPVLMKDAEGDIVGVWRQKADDMKHSVGMKVVPEGSLRFIMDTEGGGSAKESGS